MKLLIVSHTPHYLQAGLPAGWGPTVREIDHLASLFDEITHLAPLHNEPAPDAAFPYRAGNIRLRPVPAAGGGCFLDKLAILWQAPRWVGAILDEMRRADVVHVRCPAGISLIAVVLLAVASRPRRRWIKYAGNWRPQKNESWSYRFQRWWLEWGRHRGLVTVNGSWPGQPSFIRSFLNPCLTDSELAEGRAAVAKPSPRPLRAIFVGRLETPKGVGRLLHILAMLRARGLDVHTDLVGDGPERARFERQAGELGVSDLAHFHGWLPRMALAPLYGRAHVMLFPTSSSEGWPKVLSEAMAYGVVPIAGNVSSIPQLLERFAAGRALDPDDLEAMARAVAAYADHPGLWSVESANAASAAAQFTYSRYLDAVRELLTLDDPQTGTAVGRSWSVT